MKYSRQHQQRIKAATKYIPLLAVVVFIATVTINCVRYEHCEVVVPDVIEETMETEVIVETEEASEVEQLLASKQEVIEVEEVSTEVEETPEITYYDIDLSHEMQDWIRTCLDYIGSDLDDSYIVALIYHESGFNPTALGTAGDSGYCQILQKYFNETYENMESQYPELADITDKDIWDERANIAVGIFYLNDCAVSLSGETLCRNNLTMSLTGYNRGKNGARNLYNSTGSYQSSYSVSIIEYAQQLQETNTITE